MADNNTANSDGMIIIMLYRRSVILISYFHPFAWWISMAAMALLPPSASSTAWAAPVHSTTVRVAAAPFRIAGKPVAIGDGSIRFTGTLHTLGKNFIVAARGGIQAGAATLAWPAAHSPVISIHTLTASGHIHLWHDAAGIAHIDIKNGLSVVKALQIKTQTLSNVEIKWGMLHHILTVASLEALWNGTKNIGERNL